MLLLLLLLLLLVMMMMAHELFVGVEGLGRHREDVVAAAARLRVVAASAGRGTVRLVLLHGHPGVVYPGAAAAAAAALVLSALTVYHVQLTPAVRTARGSVISFSFSSFDVREEIYTPLPGSRTLLAVFCTVYHTR